MEERRRGDARCDRLARRRATLDDFDWRISIAEIASDGPFSTFPGIDRQLAVLQGKVALTIEGRAPVTLDPDRPLPWISRARPPSMADLVDGPSMDLNVMTRRGPLRLPNDRCRSAGATDHRRAGVTVIVARSTITNAGEPRHSTWTRSTRC